MFNIHEDAKKYEDYVIGLRHEFHRHPELSDQEGWTRWEFLTPVWLAPM